MSELGTPIDGQPTDQFATIADVPITPANDTVNPNQVRSGVTRGTQTYMNTDGSYMTMGLIPNTTDFGIAFFTAAGKLISKSTSTIDYKYDTSGNLIFKNTGQTQYVYDITTGKNVIQIGKLPDGTYGWAVAKSGYDVADIFT